jgi:type I restriction enzyme R subunit
MVFLTEKIHRKISASWTFVVITDRTELDDQIAATYTNCGKADSKTDQARAASSCAKCCVTRTGATCSRWCRSIGSL